MWPYVNVYLTLKEILLKSHEIMLISVNWHLIGYRNIAMICHLPDKATLCHPPPTTTPLNTVLYLWSRCMYYLVLLCNIIYIQSKSYVALCKCVLNVKRNFTEKPWNNVDICKLTFNWIQKYCNDLPSTTMTCIITSKQLEWNALVLARHVLHINISLCEIDSVALNTIPLVCKCYKNGLCNITDWSNKFILSRLLQ